MTNSFKPSDYPTFKQEDFKHRWLKLSHLTEQINRLSKNNSLQVKEIGESEEGRPLKSISFGNGLIKILIWSQMHGNESTATMSIVDLLNFLSADGDIYDNFRKEIKKKFSLVFVPMLNPDGAERFTRRNALHIDMNRDALAQESLEMKNFMQLFKAFKPHWAFNLHDQRNFFSTGTSSSPATISFLAASSSPDRKIDATRFKSMQLIAAMAELIEERYPRHCGRYSDEYYPRALGEFFHQQEVPCVLIESGAHKNDPFRDVARELNFLSLLKALENLQSGSYLEYDEHAYLAIPENGKSILDLLIKDCQFAVNGSKVDLGFMISEKVDKETGELCYCYLLTDIGDLSFQYGLLEFKGGRIEDFQSLELDEKANLQIDVEDGRSLVFKEGKLLKD